MEFTISIGLNESIYKDYDFIQVGVSILSRFCSLPSFTNEWTELNKTEFLPIETEKSMKFSSLLVVPEKSCIRLVVMGQKHRFGFPPQGKAVLNSLVLNEVPTETPTRYSIPSTDAMIGIPSNNVEQKVSSLMQKRRDDSYIQFDYVGKCPIPWENISHSFRLISSNSADVTLYVCKRQLEIWEVFLRDIHDNMEKIIHERLSKIQVEYETPFHICDFGDPNVKTYPSRLHPKEASHRGIAALLRDREIALSRIQTGQIRKSRELISSKANSIFVRQFCARNFEDESHQSLRVMNQHITIEVEADHIHDNDAEKPLCFDDTPSVKRILEVFYISGLRSQEISFRKYIITLQKLHTEITSIGKSYMSLNQSIKQVRHILRQTADLLVELYSHVKFMLDHVTERAKMTIGILDEIEDSIELIYSVQIPQLFSGRQASTHVACNDKFSFEEILDSADCAVQRVILLLENLIQSADGSLRSNSLHASSWQRKVNLRPWFGRLMIDPCTLRILATIGTTIWNFIVEHAKTNMSLLSQHIWPRISSIGYLLPFYWNLDIERTHEPFSLDKMGQVLLELGRRLFVTFHSLDRISTIQLRIQGHELILSIPIPAHIFKQFEAAHCIAPVRIVPFLVVPFSTSYTNHFPKGVPTTHTPMNSTLRAILNLNFMFCQVIRRYLENAKRVLVSKNVGEHMHQNLGLQRHLSGNFRTADSKLIDYEKYLKEFNTKISAGREIIADCRDDGSTRGDGASPIILVSRVMDAISGLVNNSNEGTRQMPSCWIQKPSVKKDEIFNCVDLDIMHRILKIK